MTELVKPGAAGSPRAVPSKQMELKVQRNATFEDWESVPEGESAQLIDGVLYITSRPNIHHATAVTYLIQSLTPFSRDRAKGWVLLFEPALRFGSDFVVGDIAGWRRERLPTIPRGAKWIDTAPDFICEALSPSTAKIDRGRKRELYAKAKVSHVWFIDPLNCTLEVLALAKGIYQVVASAGGDDRGRFPPFDVELDLAMLWEP